MSQRWVISDTHFGHANILKFYPDQPWSTIRERDEGLIDLWNQYVRPEDRIYHLGDVTLWRGNRQNQVKMINIVRRLNGHKTLYLGNHDHFEAKVYLEAGFEDIRATWRDNINLLYSHFPLHPNHLGNGIRAMVHGHIHDSDSPAPARGRDAHSRECLIPYVNVSVERTNYHPITVEEVLARAEAEIKRWEGKLCDTGATSTPDQTERTSNTP